MQSNYHDNISNCDHSPNAFRLFAIFLIISFLFIPVISNADTLVIPDIANQPGAAPDNTPRPARAMTMDQVRSEFGPPREAVGPIGNPPITRWIYDNFIVTFESEYVIHSAAKRK